MGKGIFVYGAGALIAMVAVTAHAMGLGKLVVESRLDEPFEATIPITGMSGNDFDAISASLGTPEDFARTGLPRPASLTMLEFRALRGDGAAAHIRVTSPAPVHEPYLQFLVVLQWSGGRAVREYTALLNPPGYTIQRPTPISAPALAAPSATPAPRESPAQDVDRWEVQRGDTLWRIAERVKGSRDADVYQTMVALYRANPDAFVNADINLLRAGAVLQVPDTVTVTATSRSEARTEFHQLASPQVATIPPAPVPAAAAPAAAEPGPAPVSAAVPVAQPETPAAGATAPSDATVAESAAAGSTEETQMLRIVGAGQANDTGDQSLTASRSGEGAASDAAIAPDIGASIQNLTDRIAMLEEAVLSKELENQELRDRLRVLEEQFQSRPALIDIEQGEIALAQQQAAMRAEEGVEVDTLQVTTDAVATDDNATPMLATVVTDNDTGAAQGRPESPEPVALAALDATAVGDNETMAPAAPGPTEEQTEPGQDPVVTSTEEPAAGTGASSGSAAPETATSERSRFEGRSVAWWKDIASDVWKSAKGTPLAAAGALGLGLLGLLVWRRRREEGDAGGGDGEEGVMWMPSSVKPRPAADAPARGSDTAAGANKIDPNAEADVYLAYGRDDEAEQVLRAALASDPDQPELQLKLLEIHKRRGDADAFRSLARELRTLWADERPDLWQQVVLQGGGLLAAEELLDAPEVMDSPPSLDDELWREAEHGELSDEEEGIRIASHEPAAEPSPIAEPKPPDAPRVTAPATEFSLDYTTHRVDEPEPAASSDASASAQRGEGDSIAWDSVGTKLDLARAYLDMGDVDYAQGLLDDVLREGTAEQRAEADRLLAQLKSESDGEPIA